MENPLIVADVIEANEFQDLSERYRRAVRAEDGHQRPCRVRRLAAGGESAGGPPAGGQSRCVAIGDHGRRDAGADQPGRRRLLAGDPGAGRRRSACRRRAAPGVHAGREVAERAGSRPEASPSRNRPTRSRPAAGRRGAKPAPKRVAVGAGDGDRPEQEVHRRHQDQPGRDDGRAVPEGRPEHGQQLRVPLARGVLQRGDLPPDHQGLHGPDRRPAGHRHGRCRLQVQRRAVRPADVRQGHAGDGERRPEHPGQPVLHLPRAAGRDACRRTTRSSGR